MTTSVKLSGEDEDKVEKIKNNMMIEPSTTKVVREALDQLYKEVIENES